MINFFHRLLGYRSNTTRHRDLSQSRIRKDTESIDEILQVLRETFINPFSESELVSISTGLMVSELVTDHLLNAQTYGKSSMEKVMCDRLKENSPIDFYEPVKKLNLHIFQNMTKVVVSIKDRMVPIKCHRNLFGQISIIMQHRDVDLKCVFFLSSWIITMVTGWTSG